MYLTVVQIAESFGVSADVVEHWAREENLPFVQDRQRRLFDRTQVADWAAARGLGTHTGFLVPTVSSVVSGGGIAALLRAGGIWRDVRPEAVTSVFERVVGGLPGATEPIRALLVERLRAPGGVVLAPVGGGFALPHPSNRISLGRGSGAVALVLLNEPLRMDDPPPDDVPVNRLLFFIASSPRAHLDLLGRLSRMLMRGPVRDALRRGVSDGEIFEAVGIADNATGSDGGAAGRR